MAVERNSGTLTETEWKRKEGMELLRSGMKQTAVAKKVGVNPRTVYEWKKRIENDHGYRSRKKTDRKSHLPVEQKETLKKIIDSGALACGHSRGSPK